MEMTKGIQCDGHLFTITVVVNYRVERHPGGSRFHQVSIKSVGSSDYHKTEEVLDSELEKEISRMKQDVIRWVKYKKHVNDPAVIKLTELGFK